jgi:hypothetical protein
MAAVEIRKNGGFPQAAGNTSPTHFSFPPRRAFQSFHSTGGDLN